MTAFELGSELVRADHVLNDFIARGSSNIANFTFPRLSNFERDGNNSLLANRAADGVADCLLIKLII